MIKVLIAAGGSGGHLFPAQQLRQLLGSQAEVVFAGHKLKGSPFFDSEKIPFQEIASAPLKRGFLSALWKGFWQSIFFLRLFRPDVVVGFGSYHTFPLLLASIILRKKLILFEANSTLGKVNHFFYPFARKVAFQFGSSRQKEILVPLLPWISENPKSITVSDARKYFGLDPNKTTLLVFGGSQGSSFLNQKVALAIDQFKGDIQVIHLTGKGGGSVSYKVSSCVKEFEMKMAYAYLAADGAICRSGAGTIAELIGYELPSLLIPFPDASDDHQRKNGEFFIEKTKGARLLIQKEATLDRLLSELEILLGRLEIFREGLRKYRLECAQRVDLASFVCAMVRKNGD